MTKNLLPVSTFSIVARDPDRESRQFGSADSQGRAHAHTGAECMDWAGHLVGENFTCQGNIRIALAAFHGAENFEERAHRADVIDQVVLGFLQQKAASVN